ncbi:unnamed protein product [Macrosiphum euphorbiae]|uniref:Uncharacterized protein n=1 Tax=Macrosiphum euphorbiae TaxID=13131 RepID=A0AAV0VV14_9HEMI|nr:unnamed protein product [Macrosiphum euphorbiae]
MVHAGHHLVRVHGCQQLWVELFEHGEHVVDRHMSGGLRVATDAAHWLPVMYPRPVGSYSSTTVMTSSSVASTPTARSAVYMFLMFIRPLPSLNMAKAVCTSANSSAGSAGQWAAASSSSSPSFDGSASGPCYRQNCWPRCKPPSPCSATAAAGIVIVAERFRRRWLPFGFRHVERWNGFCTIFFFSAFVFSLLVKIYFDIMYLGVFMKYLGNKYHS